MEKDRNKMATRILSLTLEIIYLLTGEDYVVVKKSGEDQILEGQSRTQCPISEPSLLSTTAESNSDQKILEVTQKMIGLLTIRCQDVTVYFSMEEWEYLEGHKDLYKDVMMEDHQTLPTPGEPLAEDVPSRGFHPRLSMRWSKHGDEKSSKSQRKGDGLKFTMASKKQKSNRRDVTGIEGSHTSPHSHECPSFYRGDQTQYISTPMKEGEAELHTTQHGSPHGGPSLYGGDQTQYSSTPMKEGEAELHTTQHRSHEDPSLYGGDQTQYSSTPMKEGEAELHTSHHRSPHEDPSLYGGDQTKYTSTAMKKENLTELHTT
ncbi:uncharacterized protein ACMZJ9_014519, partial [Mantella aurantiaca]